MTESTIGSKIHTRSICHTASKYTKLSGLHFQKGKKKTPKDIYIIGLATTCVPICLKLLIRYLAKEELRFQNHPAMPRQQSNQILLAGQVTDPQ